MILCFLHAIKQILIICASGKKSTAVWYDSIIWYIVQISRSVWLKRFFFLSEWATYTGRSSCWYARTFSYRVVWYGALVLCICSDIACCNDEITHKTKIIVGCKINIQLQSICLLLFCVHVSSLTNKYNAVYENIKLWHLCCTGKLATVLYTSAAALVPMSFSTYSPWINTTNTCNKLWIYVFTNPKHQLLFGRRTTKNTNVWRQYTLKTYIIKVTNLMPM